MCISFLWDITLVGGNLTRILKINFRFHEIAKIFNSLPAKPGNASVDSRLALDPPLRRRGE